MKVRALPSAREDLREAGRRLDREHRGFGSRLIKEYRKAVAAIRATPRQHSPTEDGLEDCETREFFIALFNYRVIFTIEGTEAIILTVIHAARPPGLWVPRLGEVSNPEELP